MLSKKTEYALSALSFLASRYNQGPASSADIALHKQIPTKFLSNILVDLRKAGLVDSKKGKGGGYFLNASPDYIRLSEIVRLFNGPVNLLPAVNNYPPAGNKQPDSRITEINDLFIHARDSALKTLEKRTLTSIM
jgi:Rrf2 family protein